MGADSSQRDVSLILQRETLKALGASMAVVASFAAFWRGAYLRNIEKEPKESLSVLSTDQRRLAHRCGGMRLRTS
jgi:hypothetical protein